MENFVTFCPRLYRWCTRDDHGTNLSTMARPYYISHVLLTLWTFLISAYPSSMCNRYDFNVGKFGLLWFEPRHRHKSSFILTKPLQNDLLVEKRIANSVPPSPVTDSMLENICAEGHCCSWIIHHLYSQLRKFKACEGVISQRYQEIIPSWIPWKVTMLLASSIADDWYASEGWIPLQRLFSCQWHFLELFLNCPGASKKVRMDAFHRLVN